MAILDPFFTTTFASAFDLALTADLGLAVAFDLGSIFGLVDLDLVVFFASVLGVVLETDAFFDSTLGLVALAALEVLEAMAPVFVAVFAVFVAALAVFAAVLAVFAAAALVGFFVALIELPDVVFDTAPVLDLSLEAVFGLAFDSALVAPFSSVSALTGFALAVLFALVVLVALVVLFALVDFFTSDVLLALVILLALVPFAFNADLVGGTFVAGDFFLRTLEGIGVNTISFLEILIGPDGPLGCKNSPASTPFLKAELNKESKVVGLISKWV